MHMLIVGILIVCNGLLSMSEFAVVSSERSRLHSLVNQGKRGASIALELVENPNRFLSTVQVGITLVGILVGVFGGARIAEDLARLIGGWRVVGEYAQPVSLLIVVGTTTYLTLVIGELVPKQLAIRRPEKVASWIAGPMKGLSIVTYPLVVFLSASSSVVLRLLGQHEKPPESVSEEEVKLLLRRGQEAGIFRRAEAQMIAGVFRLDDIRADAVMTPRVDVDWLDVDARAADVLATIERSGHSHYPVCEGSIDRVAGVVSTTAVAAAVLRGEDLDLRRIAEPAEFVPESSDAGTLVSRVARSGRRFMIVVSEHGGVDGIVTTHDLAEAVLGDLGKPEARRSEDGSWLISGSMPIEEVEAVLEVSGMREDRAKSYGTIAGFVLNELGTVPRGGEVVEWRNLRIKVERVANNRVRQVRVWRFEHVE